MPESDDTWWMMLGGEDTAAEVVSRLISLSCWFEVTPYPDDLWRITVKNEHGTKKALRSIVEEVQYE